MAEDVYGMSAGASRDCGFQSYRLRLSIVPTYSKPRPQDAQANQEPALDYITYVQSENRRLEKRKLERSI